MRHIYKKVPAVWVPLGVLTQVPRKLLWRQGNCAYGASPTYISYTKGQITTPMTFLLPLSLIYTVHSGLTKTTYKPFYEAKQGYFELT